MSIEIKNLRCNKPSPKQSHVRVDRASVLGNPFNMSKINTRDVVCDKYETYAYEMMVGSSPKAQEYQKEMLRLLALFTQYGELTLYCWCAPKRCHAETIKEWLVDNTIIV